MINNANGDANSPTEPDSFATLTPIRISEISPISSSNTNGYIEAVIVLIWPYSSSSRSLSLLLADKDVRLRRSKGQVKVNFDGKCAEAVALTRLEIGDTVKLGLLGASWMRTGEEVSTPGRKIEWDLQFSLKLTLEVLRDRQLLGRVEHEHAASPESSDSGRPYLAPYIRTNGTGEASDSLSSTEFSSPAFVHSKRHSSGSFLDASLDPFADDDGFVLGKGRKRTKFARHSGTWRLADDSSDSQGETQASRNGVNGDIAPIVLSDDESEASPVPLRSDYGTKLPSRRAADDTLSIEMPPPQFRPLRPQLLSSDDQHSPAASDAEVGSEAETTPRLHPLSSPGLPLISPLVKHSGVQVGYFPELDAPMSELDASGETSPVPDRPKPRDLQTSGLIDVVSLITPEDEVFPQDHGFRELSQPEGSELARHEDVPEHDEVQNLDVPSAEDFTTRSFIPIASEEFPGDQGMELLQDLERMIEGEDMYGPPEPIQQVATNDSNRAHENGQIFHTDPGLIQGSNLHSHLDEHYFPNAGQPVVPELVQREEHGSPDVLHPFISQSASERPPKSSPTRRSLDGAVEEAIEIVQRADEPSTANLSLERATQSAAPELGFQAVGTESNAFDSPKSHLRKGVEYPPTPEATQEGLQPTSEFVSGGAAESQMLPTPQKTQKSPSSFTEEVAIIVGQQQNSAEAVALELTKSQAAAPSILRRSRRHMTSLVSDFISHDSSPYFTSVGSSDMQSSPPPPSVSGKENVPPRSGSRKSPARKEPLPTVVEDVNGVVKEKSKVLSKSALTYGLSTPSSYYPPLAAIGEFFRTNVDILAMCSSATPKPQRAETGPKDFHCTLQLADPSLPAHEIVVAQIFRPYKIALPSPKRGDVILLRDMRVQTLKGKFTLLSTETSSWVVFASPEPPYTKTSLLDTTIAGPPIEFGPDERLGANDLMQWWDKDGYPTHPAPKEKSQASPETSVVNGATERADTVETDTAAEEAPRALRRSRRKANYTDNIDEDIELEVESTKEPPRRRSDASPASQRPSTAGSLRSRRFESVIHELRDGTKYVDDDNEDRIRRARRSGSLIHELRDGRSYVDE